MRKKIQLILSILKIDNVAFLTEIKTIVYKCANANKAGKARFRDLLGLLSEQESDNMKRIIADSFEIINPDDWK